MMIRINERKFVEQIIEKDITFPFIGWWSSKKDKIIKICYEYYDVTPKLPKQLKCIIIQNGWNFHPSIFSKIIPISNEGVVDDEIIPLLRDFSDVATEQEFQEFKESTLKILFK